MAEAAESSSATAASPAESQGRPLVKPEVLSPAGGWEQLRAAVANGCDAVYFGVTDGFNARARANNFAYEELPEVMAFLGEYGVKGFACVNVLVFEEEVERVKGSLRKLQQSKVDAIIVQDAGVMKLAREVAPNLEVHASTQCSVSSAGGSKHIGRLGATRVVLGRELSIAEIGRINADLNKERHGEGGWREHAGMPPELEVFVHGALCVSYSGQCFSSEAWGGRSANRGQCAQACRMPYVALAAQCLSYSLSLSLCVFVE